MNFKISTTKSRRLFEDSNWERFFYISSIFVTGFFIIIQGTLELILRDHLLFSPIVALVTGAAYIATIPYVKKLKNFSGFVKVAYFISLGILAFRILTSAGINSGITVWSLLVMAYVLFFASLRFFIFASITMLLTAISIWIIQYYDLLDLNQYYTHYHPILGLSNVTLGGASLFFLCLYFAHFKTKSEEDLMQARAVAFHSAKLASLGELAGGVAHEVNNPLSILMGSAEITVRKIQKGTLTNQECLDFALKVKNTTGRIARIVGALRSLARKDFDDPFIRIKVDDLIQSVMDLVTEKMETNQIQFIVEKYPRELEIYCRPIQIEHVLMNLINNAFDAVREAEKRVIRVEIKTLPKNMIQIIVEDSGPGIPPEIQDRIMDPFFTTKDVRQGTGLGLSISAAIVNDHNGRLYLAKNQPQTQFILELPNN